MLLVHIEDNAADRLLLKDLLTKVHLKAKLQQFPDLESGVKYCEELKADIDFLILLDLGLPPLKGLDALNEILNKVPESAIIVLTGRGFSELGEQALKNGAMEFLEKKDLSPATLERTIRTSLERYRLIRALQRTNSDKDKLLSLIAHDLRNSFAAILSLTEIVNEELARNESADIREQIDLIQNSASKASILLSNLLEWSRLELGLMKALPETLSVAELFEEALGFFTNQIKQKDLLVIKQVPEDQHIYGDRQAYLSILRNLISNAIKFSHRQGKVHLKCIPSGAYSSLEVSDHGIGIPDSIIPHLFTGNKGIGRPGTEGEASAGLGLMLSSNLALRNNSRLEVSSKADFGSTFRLISPTNKPD